jgi:uncharacterized membrane protein YgdD (TMEM256/DUF423 family)
MLLFRLADFHSFLLRFAHSKHYSAKSISEILNRLMSCSPRVWIMVGALSGALSVITGAFGAHALRSRLSERSMEIYQTACHYQITHALALIGVGLWAAHLAQAGQSPVCSLSFAGWAFTIGTVLFSGSLYALALTDVKILGAITPLGGVGFILGWVAFAVSAWKAVS